MLLFSFALVGRFRKKTFPFGWHGRYSVLNTVTLDWWSSWVVPPLEDWVEAELFLSERRDDSQFAGCTQYVVFISGGRKPNSNTIIPIIFFEVHHSPLLIIFLVLISLLFPYFFMSLLSVLRNDRVEKIHK